jgi:hypothetical protein
MLLQDRGWAHVRDISLDRASHRFGFSRIRYRQDHESASHDLPHTHRNGSVGHSLNSGEPPLSELLLAAPLIKLDYYVRLVCFEIGRWIVKRKVSVFADPGKHHVDRACLDEPADPAEFLIKIRGVATDKMERT